MLNFSWVGDHEGALRTMVGEANQLTKGGGEWAGATSESSAVDESAGNGRAERAVQALEDHTMSLPG